MDWVSEIETILKRARSRNLPELSGDEMMAELKAVRASGARRLRYDGLDERVSIANLDIRVTADHARVP